MLASIPRNRLVLQLLAKELENLINSVTNAATKIMIMRANTVRVCTYNKVFSTANH